MIKNACDEDADTATALISAAGLQMPQSSLTLVVDAQGMYYRVPICVINDPRNYNADVVKKKMLEKKAPQEKTINVSCVRCGNEVAVDV